MTVIGLLHTYEHINSGSYLIVSMLACVAVGWVTALNERVSSYFVGKRLFFFSRWLVEITLDLAIEAI